MSKKVFIKIYDNNGNFKGLYDQFTFSSFTASINSGLGELNFTIPAKFDDFGEGNTLNYNYRVQIYIADKEAPNGVKIYDGYIVEYTSHAGQTEDVTIRAFGSIAKLSQDVLVDTSTGQNVIKLVYSNADPGFVMRQVLDKYRIVNPSSLINYTTSTIIGAGVGVNIQFDGITYQDAIDRLKNCADPSFYYYLDVDNLLYFQQIPTLPTHLFMFRRNIADIEIVKSIVNMKNTLIFWNGRQKEDPLYISKGYGDSTSQASYGRQTEKKREHRFDKTSSADAFANRYIASLKDPIKNLTFKVLDSNFYSGGYDIEKIKPGQTCKILNINPNSVLSNNMIITKVTYNISDVEIEVSDYKQYLDRTLNELALQFEDISKGANGPITYI